MPLEASERTVDGVTIVDLRGRLTMGSETDIFTEKMDALVQAKALNVLLNMQHLGTIDSTGLGTLVLAQSRLKEVGGSIKLLQLSMAHRDLLVLTKLTAIFPSFDDEQAAIDSFFPERTPTHFDILEFVQSQRKHAEQDGAKDENSGTFSDEPTPSSAKDPSTNEG